MTHTRDWEPGVDYKLGDVVRYKGHKYRIIQPHRSQSDWTPDKTPALWGRIPDHDDYDDDDDDDRRGDVKQPDSYGQYPVDVPQQEQKKKWYDVDDKHKKQIEVAGGIAAGAALLAGGIAAYRHHEQKKKTEEEVSTLSFFSGFHVVPFQGDYHGDDVKQPNDSSQHTDQTVNVPQQEQGKKLYDDKHKKQLEAAGGIAAGAALLAGGYAAYQHHEHKKQTEEGENAGPVTWIHVERREDIPPQALEVGRDRDGNPIYVARVSYQGSLQVGKAARVFKQGAVIPYAGQAVEFSAFEVLVADPRAIRWVRYSYQLNVQQVGARPVEGGREADGAPLYIARVEYEGGVHTAKVGEHLPGANVAFHGGEVQVEDYEVLVYSN
ncbi:hypothetical protein BC827DRAFT_334920 [Russula dissimulans]|nr:hypothetical protein BC827DRAFT_334920 [Russula dissimulans]